MLSAFAVRRFYGVVTARAMPGRFLHATSISMEDILTNGCKICGLPADLGPALLNGKRHQSPHMLEIEWSEDEWRKPVMQANSDSQSDVSERVDLTMPGTAFAKINCVKDYDGNIRLFRPSTTLDRYGCVLGVLVVERGLWCLAGMCVCLVCWCGVRCC